jgi:hypothetical protein
MLKRRLTRSPKSKTKKVTEFDVKITTDQGEAQTAKLQFKAPEPASVVQYNDPKNVAIVDKKLVEETEKITDWNDRDSQFILHQELNKPGVSSSTENMGRWVEGVADKNIRPNFKEISGSVSEYSQETLQLMMLAIKQQLDMFSKKDPTKAEEEKVEELRKLELVYDEPFLLLPQLRSVMHPIRLNEQIAVGSRAWLRTFDELIIAGWVLTGKNSIYEFLEKSAKIIEEDLNFFTVKTGDDGTIKNNSAGILTLFNVIKFNMYFPDASRQKDKRKKIILELEKLIAEKNRTPGNDVFTPQNIREIQSGKTNKCEPQVVDLTIGDNNYTNILRHWTTLDKDSQALRLVDNQLVRTIRCAPPEEIRYNWIPIEFKKDLEEKLNITTMKFCPPKIWKELLLLLQESEFDEGHRLWDNYLNQPFIVLQNEEKAYKLYRRLINFTEIDKPYPLQSEEDLEFISARKWILQDKMKFDVKKYHSLLWVIFNADVPSNAPKMYNDFIITMEFDGKIIKRYSMDAPVRAIQSALLQSFASSAKNGESVSDCKERFVREIYMNCLMSGFNDEDLEDSVHPDYRKVIEAIFDFGNNQNCVVPQKRIDVPLVGINDIFEYNDRQKALLLNDIQAFIENDAPAEAFNVAY